MKDAEGAIRILGALKNMGVQLAIDDFGTGYSSLSYLKQFPIDRLKIDQAFVRDINSDPNDAAIAMAVISMASSMHLGVVAEGVESEAQLKFLEAKKCEEIQGYYFSKPLPPDEIATFLKHPHSFNLEQCAATVSPRTLLFVDDDISTLSALSKILKSEQYCILNAKSAEEGFSLLARHRIGVVISDYMMPEMNGAEFLKRVKDLYPTITRVMLSGESDMKSLIATVNEGAIYKVLEKPIRPSILKHTLREAFKIHEARLPQAT